MVLLFLQRLLLFVLSPSTRFLSMLMVLNTILLLFVSLSSLAFFFSLYFVLGLVLILTVKRMIDFAKHFLSRYDLSQCNDLSSFGGKESMITYFIPLLASFLDVSWLRFWFYPLFALAFIATVPSLLRSVCFWR